MTLIIRSGEISDSVKYWIKPDLENRIKDGSIVAHFNTTINEITESAVVVESPRGPETIAAEWVLAMTGYRPDYNWLAEIGIEVDDTPELVPVHDPDSFETNRAGIYLAGTVCGGLNTGRWFIENGRFHARQILDHMANTPVQSKR